MSHNKSASIFKKWTCNRKYISYIFMLFLCSLSFNSFCQTNFKENDINENFKIEFDKNTCKLTDASKKMLDEKASFLKKKIEGNQCVIVISTKTCRSELKKNKNIGLLRCRVIMDYLEEKHKIERSNYFIIDEHFNGLEDEMCTNTRFVNFRFVCE